MKKEETEPSRPYTLTLHYDRSLCGECQCASCYAQEFCDRCSTCKDKSRYLSRCNRYEGAFNY